MGVNSPDNNAKSDRRNSPRLNTQESLIKEGRKGGDAVGELKGPARRFSRGKDALPREGRETDSHTMAPTLGGQIPITFSFKNQKGQISRVCTTSGT